MVILISGKAESGKDTFATKVKEIMEMCGYNVCITHFAKYLKIILKDYYGWNGEKDEYGRHLLQYVGTEKIRNELNKKDFHANRIKEDIEIIRDNFDFIIIPDLRFDNEYDIIKKFFITKVVKIIRANNVSNLTEVQLEHESENGLSDKIIYDYVLGASDMSELNKNVIWFCNQLVNEE